MNTEFYGPYGPYGTDVAAQKTFDVTLYFSNDSITFPNVEHLNVEHIKAAVNDGKVFGIKVSSTEHYRINPAQVHFVKIKERVENQEAH